MPALLPVQMWILLDKSGVSVLELKVLSGILAARLVDLSNRDRGIEMVVGYERREMYLLPMSSVQS